MNDETKQNLVDLLVSYDGKLADETFIRLAIGIMVNGLGLKDYVSSIVYIPRDDMLNPIYEEYTKGFSGLFGQAAYVAKKREIVIYELNLFYAKEMAARDNDVLEDKNNFINLLILQTIFHELEHANQQRLLTEGSTVEADFLRILAEVDKSETIDSYEVSPTERGAELKSWDEIIEVAETLHLSSAKIYELLNFFRNDAMLRGYNFAFEDDYLEGCPLKQYANLRGISFERLAYIIDLLDESLYDIYGCPLELTTLEEKTGLKVDLKR